MREKAHHQVMSGRAEGSTGKGRQKALKGMGEVLGVLALAATVVPWFQRWQRVGRNCARPEVGCEHGVRLQREQRSSAGKSSVPVTKDGLRT